MNRDWKWMPIDLHRLGTVEADIHTLAPIYCHSPELHFAGNAKIIQKDEIPKFE